MALAQPGARHLSLFGMVLLGLLTLGRERADASQHSLWWLQAMLYWPLLGPLWAGLPMAQALADPLSLLAHAAPVVLMAPLTLAALVPDQPAPRWSPP